MKRLLVIVSLIFLFFNANAQDSIKYCKLSFSLFDNATVLPQHGLHSMFKSPLHPGFTIGTEISWRKRSKTEIYQTIKAGYFYQRFVQHAIQLYTETGYRYTHKTGFGAFAQLGAGYLHSFVDQQQFVFKNGEYKKKFPFGRAQAMLSLTPGIFFDFSKKLNKPVSVFIAYQAWFQFPYVRQYVPLFPNAAFHLGVIYKIKNRK
jgi:hypothetical protein